MKKLFRWPKVENKLKDITEWDSFYDAFPEIEESTSLWGFLDSGDEYEEMDCENIAEVNSCVKDNSEDTHSEDDSSCARLHSFSDWFIWFKLTVFM